MERIAAALLLLLLFHPSVGAADESAHRLKTRLFQFNQESRNYEGKFIEAGIDYSFASGWLIGAGGQRLRREFDGGGDISDSGYHLNLGKSFADGYYIESQYRQNPNAEIVPEWAYQITPHKVIGSADFGLGIDYKEYAKTKAGSLHPFVLYDLTGRWALHGGVFVARTGETLIASHATVVLRHASHTLRFGGAQGETLEDAGLTAHFKSVVYGYTVKIKSLNLIFDYNRYWSDLRTENAFGFGVAVQ